MTLSQGHLLHEEQTIIDQAEVNYNSLCHDFLMLEIGQSELTSKTQSALPPIPQEEAEEHIDYPMV